MAKRLIAYKNKISEEWLEKKTNESKNESDNETSASLSFELFVLFSSHCSDIFCLYSIKRLAISKVISSGSNQRL